MLSILIINGKIILKVESKYNNKNCLLQMLHKQ